MPTPRLNVERTLIEKGTFKCPVRDAIFHWAELQDKFQIPEDAYMAVEIPGGGDWSGERVDASEIECVVTWERQVNVE